MPPILSICIPTFNRCTYLEYLLEVLRAESEGLEDRIEIIISDNASTDGTADIVSSFVARTSNARAIRNDENIGADGNLLQCFNVARSEYVWVFGDDDLPRAGLIRTLLDVLSSLKPAMVFLPSVWTTQVRSEHEKLGEGLQTYEVLPHRDFAARVSFWFTFISGIIVSKGQLQALGDEPDRFTGTNFVQLGWTFPMLRSERPLVAFNEPAVLATAGNTGGYAVVTTFGVAFPRVVRQSFGQDSALTQLLISRLLISYLPGLIWNVRFAKAQRYTDEDPWAELRKAFRNDIAYWLLVAPITRAPKPVAAVFLLLSRAFGRALRIGSSLRRPTSVSQT